MKTRILVLGVLLAGLMADQAWALCEVQATPQTYSDGTVLNGNVCDTTGALKISGDIGNVSISSADGAITDGVSAAIKATVKDYTNSNPLTTILVDTNGDPASVGGGTQYAQGTASTTTDTMTMAGCVRVDTPAVASGVIDGDRARCMVDSTGRMWVHVGVIDGTVAATQSGTWNVGQSGTWTLQPGNTANTTPWLFSISQGGNTAAVNASSQLSVNCANCSGSGVSQQDNTGFTPGTTNFVPMGGEVDDTGTTAVTENSAGAARITAQRAVHMNLRNNSGTEIGTSGNPLVVGDGSGAMNVIVDSSALPTGAAADATLTGGTQKAIVRGGAKGGTSAADVTSTASGANHQAVDVVIYDTSGNPITSFGGGTQYAEDSVHSSGDTMTLAGVVQQTADSALAVDGDRTLMQVDSSGFLKVINKNPNLAADNSANSSNKVPALVGVATSSAPTYTNTNQVPLSLDLSGALRVTGGTAATQYTEDAASAGAESLTLAGTIRQDTPAGSTSADGDYANLKTDSVGRLWVNNSGVTQPVSGTVSITANSAVNVAQINGVTPLMGNGASGTGAQRVTLANDSTGVLATVNSLTQMNGQTIAMGTGTRSAGTQRVTIATDDVVPASQSGTWTVQPGNTANTTPWLTSPIPATSGGTSVCYITSAASTNATNCKASAGQLYGFDLINTTTTIYYLRVYNLSSAPTCSSATGFVRTIPVPPAGAAGQAGGIARSLAVGEAYGTGLGFCLTGGGSSTDNTSAATGVYVSLNYK